MKTTRSRTWGAIGWTSRRSTASSRFCEHGCLRSLAQNDEYVSGINASRRDSRKCIERCGNSYAWRHKEHRSGGMKCRVHGGKPIGTGVDHRKPVGLEYIGMLGQQSIGWAEENALPSQRLIELLVLHVAIE